MDFKGTKGKWELKDYTIQNPNRSADKGNIFDIAQCFTGFDQNATREECKANALLISKSPEMLEMLEKFLNMHRDYDMRPEDELYEYADEVQQLIKEATEL